MLIIENLTKEINSKTILHSISFKISPGNIVALVGPNGAGKTTIIKSILGLLNPSSGEISIDGHSILKERKKYIEQVAYVPDNQFFYEELTGRQFLSFTRGLRGKDKQQDMSNEEIEQLIELLEMRDFIDKEIHTYSLGMKKKLSLLISLISNPKYLIMDEPFNGLDPITTYSIKVFLKEFAEKEGAVLISTHLLNDVEKFCTHVAIINKGSLILFDSLNNIRKKYNNKDLESLFISSIQENERAVNND